MKRLLFLLPFITHIVFGQQDTLVLDIREDLDQIIQYSFQLENSNLTPFLQNEISKCVSNYGFKKESYQDSYVISLNMKLDSCGSLLKCKSLKHRGRNGKEINNLSKKIAKLISKIGYSVKNRVCLSDKTYTLNYYVLYINIYPQLKEVSFEDPNSPTLKEGRVVKIKEENAFFIFNGFDNCSIATSKTY